MQLKTHCDRGILVVTLAQPGKGNALGGAIVEELHGVVDKIEQDSRIHTLVLRGEGKGFCGGLDLSGLEEETDASLLWRLVRIEILLQRLFALPIRTIGLAHGFAYGAGADLLCVLKWRIAAPGTKLAFPGVRFGIALGTSRLAARIGEDAAMRILMSGETLGTEAAAQTGLVTSITEPPAWDSLIEASAAPPASDRRTTAILTPQIFKNGGQNDLGALVASAALPGLKSRIQLYVAATRPAKPSRG